MHKRSVLIEPALAQVKGLDLTQELTEEQQRLVLDIWRTHELLLFRGQELSPGDQERLLLLFPHDAQAIKEERFNNKFFTTRVPGHPLVCSSFHCEDHRRDGEKSDSMQQTCLLD